MTFLRINSARATLICLIAMLLMAGCKGERCSLPFGEGGVMDLLQPDFINLYDNPGATLVINRGNMGILIHCTYLGEYVAFDCTCPNEKTVRLLPDDEKRATLLTCPQCGSRYDVFFGNPLEGAESSCPLYQYQTYYDGRYLTIY